LLGLVSVCAIVLPLPALAPVIPPVIVPIVQLKLLAALAVNAILVALPLHREAVLGVVTEGMGFTVATTGDLEDETQPVVVLRASA
jgi:hypothetical protein